MAVWSKYNHLMKRDGECFIYNSLSNSFAMLSHPLYEELRQLKVGDSIQGLSEDLMQNLLQMKALVTSDLVERQRIKYLTHKKRFRDDFLSLTICPTLGCNFRCGYCFEKDHPDIQMTEETEDKLINFIKGHKDAKRIDVTWFGGEPLLQFGRIKSLTNKILDLGMPYSAGIITNGYLLSENVAKQFSELKISRVQITLDGLAPTHDKRRFLKNGDPTYDRIISNIQRVAESIPDLYITIRVNIDQNNINDYPVIHQFIRSKNWKNVGISPAFVGDYSEGNCGYTLSASTRRMLLESYANKTGDVYPHFYPGGNRYECSVRNPNVYVIGPQGEIYKCWNDVGDPQRVVANINGEISNEELLLTYLTGADPLEDPKCQECLLLPVCGGGCPYERIRKASEENVCPLIKWNLDDFLWRKYLEYKQNQEK